MEDVFAGTHVVDLIVLGFVEFGGLDAQLFL